MPDANCINLVLGGDPVWLSLLLHYTVCVCIVFVYVFTVENFSGYQL